MMDLSDGFYWISVTDVRLFQTLGRDTGKERVDVLTITTDY